MEIIQRQSDCKREKKLDLARRGPQEMDTTGVIAGEIERPVSTM